MVQAGLVWKFAGEKVFFQGFFSEKYYTFGKLCLEGKNPHTVRKFEKYYGCKQSLYNTNQWEISKHTLSDVSSISEISYESGHLRDKLGSIKR